MRIAPLNVDQREWALKEIARLEQENAQLQDQIDKLKEQLGGIIKPPGESGGEALKYTPGEGDV